MTNDVCTVYPALSLAGDGYDVQVVADAGASPTKFADDMALRRMEKNDVTLTSTNQAIAELTGSWASPEGMQIMQEVIVPADPTLPLIVSGKKTGWYILSTELSYLMPVLNYFRIFRLSCNEITSSGVPLPDTVLVK